MPSGLDSPPESLVLDLATDLVKTAAEGNMRMLTKINADGV